MEMLDAHDHWRLHLDRLGRIAPDYPAIHEEESAGAVHCASWVPFEYNGVLFRRLHIETIIIGKFCPRSSAKERLEHYAHLTQAKAVPHQMDLVIGVKQTT